MKTFLYLFVTCLISSTASAVGNAVITVGQSKQVFGYVTCAPRVTTVVFYSRPDCDSYMPVTFELSGDLELDYFECDSLTNYGGELAAQSYSVGSKCVNLPIASRGKIISQACKQVSRSIAKKK